MIGGRGGLDIGGGARILSGIGRFADSGPLHYREQLLVALASKVYDTTTCYSMTRPDVNISFILYRDR